MAGCLGRQGSLLALQGGGGFGEDAQALKGSKESRVGCKNKNL